MKPQTKIGLIAGSLCVAMPFLSRLPHGSDWIAQYQPDEGHFRLGSLFFLAFATIPALVVFLAARISQSPFFLPAVFSKLVAAAMLAFWHHDNDLAADPQAAISLVVFPIYAAGLAVVGGVMGFGLQSAARLLQNRTEQDVDPDT